MCFMLGESQEKHRKKCLGLVQIPTDAARQLHIFRHDRDTFGMDRAQVGVLEQRNQIRFRRLLKSQDGGTLKTEVVLEVLSDLAHQTLERESAKQEIRALLVFADLS